MKLAAFDVETRGVGVAYALQPHRALNKEAWVTMCAFAKGDRVTGMRKPNPIALACWLRRCEQQGVTICGWNVAFDMAWLIAMGLREEVFANKWLDGMLLYKHLTMTPSPYGKDEFKGFGLKEAVAKFYPEDAGYDAGVLFDSDEPAEIEKLYNYMLKDGSHTLRLTEMFWAKMDRRQQQAALIEASCLPMIAAANVDGICINRDAAKALADDLETKRNVALVTLKMLSSHPVDEKVVSSPVKLRTLLFEHWGLHPIKMTDKGSYSTDKDVLGQLAGTDDRALRLLEFREAKNNRTKFAQGSIDALDYNGDGRVRPIARVYSTYTGRMTYSSKVGRGKEECPIGIALHQWKRDPVFRDLIEPPEGYDLLEFDWAGQEFRWMAVKSEDKQMLALCAPGEDAHSYMGGRIGNVTYADMLSGVAAGDPAIKKLRQFGKVSNLSCCIAGSPVLTDRGYVSIESVLTSDKLWDGVEWVNHDGPVFKGYKEVISYGGITATPDHKVLVQGKWVCLEEAASCEWEITSPMDKGWARQCWAAVRIMDGIVSKVIPKKHISLCQVSMRMRKEGGGSSPYNGERYQQRLQKLFAGSAASSRGQTYCGHTSEEGVAKSCGRHEAEMPEPQQPCVQVLRRAWDRVQICVREGWRGLHLVRATFAQLRGFGHRPQEQRRALPEGQPSAGDTQDEYAEYPTFDILNAGPRSRFTVGNCIVSNCQYRTSADTLRQVARVQHGVMMSPQEAVAIHATYRMSYPRVDRYWKDQIRIAKHQGWVETVAGRRINLGTGDTWANQDWMLSSAAINFPVQGTGADQKYLALAVLRKLLPNYNAHFYYELHDGLFIIVPKEKSMKACVELKKVLSNLPYKRAWGVDLPIHFPVDAKHGPSWGKLKEIK